MHAGLEVEAVDLQPDEGAALLSPLLQGTTRVRPANQVAGAAAMPNVVIGELLALADEGMTPLVRYVGQPGSSAISARSSIDLHGPHIGQSVVLVFEHGDALRPIVIGVLRG